MYIKESVTQPTDDNISICQKKQYYPEFQYKYNDKIYLSSGSKAVRPCRFACNNKKKHVQSLGPRGIIFPTSRHDDSFILDAEWITCLASPYFMSLSLR